MFPENLGLEEYLNLHVFSFWSPLLCWCLSHIKGNSHTHIPKSSNSQADLPLWRFSLIAQFVVKLWTLQPKLNPRQALIPGERLPKLFQLSFLESNPSDPVLESFPQQDSLSLVALVFVSPPKIYCQVRWLAKFLLHAPEVCLLFVGFWLFKLSLIVKVDGPLKVAWIVRGLRSQLSLA